MKKRLFILVLFVTHTTYISASFSTSCLEDAIEFLDAALLEQNTYKIEYIKKEIITKYEQCITANPLSFYSNSGELPLCHAASLQNPDLIAFLISLGASPRVANCEKQYPIHSLFENVHYISRRPSGTERFLTSLDLLLKQSNPNVQNINGETALHYITFPQYYFDCQQKELFQSETLETAFLLAAKKLLDSGANPNIPTFNYKSALCNQIPRNIDDLHFNWNTLIPIVTLLLHYDADPFLKDIRGQNFIDYFLNTKGKNKRNLCKILRKYIHSIVHNEKKLFTHRLYDILYKINQKTIFLTHPFNRETLKAFNKSFFSIIQTIHTKKKKQFRTLLIQSVKELDDTTWSDEKKRLLSFLFLSKEYEQQEQLRVKNEWLLYIHKLAILENTINEEV